MNPMMLFGNVIAQKVNEILPSGVVLVTLMVSVVVSICINIYTAIKKFKTETKIINQRKIKVKPFEPKEEIGLKETKNSVGKKQVIYYKYIKC